MSPSDLLLPDTLFDHLGVTFGDDEKGLNDIANDDVIGRCGAGVVKLSPRWSRCRPNLGKVLP